jgi:hypothetical protein
MLDGTKTDKEMPIEQKMTGFWLNDELNDCLTD